MSYFCRYLATIPVRLFTVIDTYPIELLFPIREGRDKGRWSIGIKLCCFLNKYGRVVGWDWDTINAHDQHFQPVAEAVSESSIVFADEGFRKADGVPDNLKLYKKAHGMIGCL